MLVDLIGRKMREKGYTIVAMEGNYLGSWEKEEMPIPWTISRHRPDLLGIQINTKKICIGEAKTSNDLFSKRTADQFSDFSNIVGRTSREKAELIIGIPLLARDKLLHLLKSLSVPLDDVSIVILPEELVGDENEENII